MKRQVFTLLVVLVLALGIAAIAQTPSNTATTPPNSQAVDQSGTPETGPGPDVDVDVGRNAEDGVVDVDVKRNTDPDTAAQGNDTSTGTAMPNDTTNDMNDADRDDLPGTASPLPLVGLIGLMSLAGACVLRATR